MDGDADLDLLAAGREDDEFVWFENLHRLGAVACAARPNSTGRAAWLAATGTRVAAANQLVLTAAGLPPGEVGYFLSSRAVDFVPSPGGSQGDLCLAEPVGRHARPVLTSGAAGRFSRALDLAHMPTPLGAVTALAGETWVFQAWYTDRNPARTSNFSDAVLLDLR